MTERPLVSVLTPSLDQGRYIRDAIESVLRQSYPAIEHVVIDGGSSDNTLHVLSEYEGRVLFVSEDDDGAADAVNKALARSRGEIIGWLNADDFYISQDAVESAVEILMSPDGPDVVYGHAVFVDASNRVLKVSPRPAFAPDRLRRFDFISQPAAFFRRTASPEPLLDPTLEFAFDYDLWLKLLDEGRRFEALDKIIAAMRYHDGAKTVRDRPESWAESHRVQTHDPANGSRLLHASDLAVMLQMKLKGLARFRARALGESRWCVPLVLPPAPLRPLYQFGVIGSQGSSLLMPRYLASVSRRRKAHP
jgi:glycosyltransferase involved in cell wall biosynthesis